MSVEEKWKANMEKVAWAKQFPGRLRTWAETVGRTVEAAVSWETQPGPVAGLAAAVIFTDRMFLVAPGPEIEPAPLLAGLAAARSRLAAVYPEAYARLDQLTVSDRTLQRQARMEKILGAVRINMPEMPELKDRLLQLLKEL